MAITPEMCPHCGKSFRRLSQHEPVCKRNQCPLVCQNCGDTVPAKLYVPQFQSCNACRKYKLRRGENRPGHLTVRGGTTGICDNCKQSPAVAKRLCDNCYRYQNKTGKARPRKWWARRENCKTCGMPREGTTRGKFTRGMCPTCAAYKKRTGKNRPPHLWKAPFGWCFCGHRATHANVPLQYMTVEQEAVRTGHYNLCDDCYALENEPVRW